MANFFNFNSLSIFEKIIGHQLILGRLEKDFRAKKLSHATLLTGSPHLGKGQVARHLARAFFCEKACGQCQTCQWILTGAHPDVHLFPDEEQSFKIETLRRLISKLHLKPQTGQSCIVIERVERMPLEAQNAFLKTLEEPPPHCFFILTSDDPTLLLPTFLSRVRPYLFFTVPEGEIEQTLIKTYRLEPPTAMQLAQWSLGRPGLALNLLQKPGLRQEYQKLYQQVEQYFTQNQLLHKMQWAETLEKEAPTLQRFFEMSFYYLRKELYRGVHPPSDLAPALSLERLYGLFESLVKTRYLIQGNVNKRLALEYFFLQTERI